MTIFLQGDVVKVLKATPAYGVGAWSDTTIPAGTVASVIRADALMDEYEITAKNATAVLTGQWLEYVCGHLDDQPPAVVDVDPGGTDHSPCRNCGHRASLHARFPRPPGSNCTGGAVCECPGLDSPATGSELTGGDGRE